MVGPFRSIGPYSPFYFELLFYIHYSILHLWQGILFYTFDRAVLYGNVSFSIVAFWSKKILQFFTWKYPDLLNLFKKSLVFFQRTYFLSGWYQNEICNSKRFCVKAKTNSHFAEIFVKRSKDVLLNRSEREYYVVIRIYVMYTLAHVVSI